MCIAICDGHVIVQSFAFLHNRKRLQQDIVFGIDESVYSVPVVYSSDKAYRNRLPFKKLVNNFV